MSTSTVGLFLRHLALSEEVGRLGTASDHDLLAIYQVERGQAAFTELMRRHGPMVLRTCRRVLGHGPDAEDAFQATFVLLARKAGQLGREAAGRQSLGGWLHRVAYQTAVNALTGATRRKTHERRANPMSRPDPDPVVEATWNEVRPILDAELDALPEKSRQLLIACYLQGKTHAEAAAELALPLGSVAWRLEKARAQLEERLVRRGIALSSALLTVMLVEAANGAGVPAVLLVHTVEAARTFVEQAAGTVSDNVARLVNSGLTPTAKGWTYPVVALAGWLSLLGAGLIAYQTLKAQPERTPSAIEASVPPAQRSEREPMRTDRYGDPLPPGALARLGTVRLRHKLGVQSLAFTHDGQGLITAGKGDPVRLWDLATGRLLRSFGDGRNFQVCAAALSPDGRTLAGRIEATGDLCLWNVATGTLLRRLKGGHANNPSQLQFGAAKSLAPLVFSPDNKLVASRDGQTLRLWDVATGNELWAADRLQVVALAFSADGKALVWASHRGGLHRWDVATGRELRCWDEENKRLVSNLVLAPNGRLLATYGPLPGASGSLARLWDITTGEEVRQLATDDAGIAAAAFSPDGKVLATSNNDGSLRLWDAATGKELRRCADCRSARCLAFSPDGKTLASGSGSLGGTRHQTVDLWDVESGRQVRRVVIGHQNTVCSVTFTPDGKEIASSGWDGSVRLWNAATGEQRRETVPVGDAFFAGGTNASIASAISPDGKTLVSAHFERIGPNSTIKVRRWDRATGQERGGWSQKLSKGIPQLLVLSPDGGIVACTVWSPTLSQVCLWKVATGAELFRIAESNPAFSPDSKLLATVPRGRLNEPGSFTLWEPAAAKQLCTVPLLKGRVHRLLFSPNGRMLATVSRAIGNPQSTIHLWPLLRDESRTPGVHVGPPRLLAEGIPPTWSCAWAFSPDERMLALSGAGGTVRLLETATGKERGRFTGHGGDVAALSFSPDGRRLASGSRDTTILVWDVTGRLEDGRLQPARLSAKELSELWDDLAADDAGGAGRAIWELAADPARTVPYLAEQLRNSVLAAKHQTSSGEQLREVRAVEVLEQIGTREAREALKALIAGVPAESSLTREASAALDRLERADR